MNKTDKERKERIKKERKIERELLFNEYVSGYGHEWLR
jgi:hypothetical protein